MKKIVYSFILYIASISSAFSIQLTDHTFIAHRDELSYAALHWTTNNHYQQDKTNDTLGGLLTATPFYSESTNNQDIALLFGIGSSGAITVTNHELLEDSFKDVLNEKLYSFNIDHSPNSDGATPGHIPMHGRLNWSPKRKSYGVYLAWDQSFENIAKGLRARIIVPIVDAQTSMNPDDSTAVASHIPATDGTSGATLRDYFSGQLTKGVSTSSQVNQKALKRGKIANDYVHAFGLADIELRLDWQCYTHEKFSCPLGSSIQLQAGNAVSNEFLFEPTIGARGHVATGLNGGLQIHAFKNKDVTVRVDLLGDMKYFFEGTERRLVSVYDKTDNVVMPASPYRLVMRNKYASVQPAANVMSLDHTVAPGFQLDALLGVSTAWKSWTIDVGYNLYWHQEEKLSLKKNDTWVDDEYAFAHNHYSMYGDKLGRFIVGGTSLNDDDEVVHNSATGTSGYNDDRNSTVSKHHNLIGANRDGWGQPVRVSYGNGVSTGSDDYYPGEFTSVNGPIQNKGKNSSALVRQDVYGNNQSNQAGVGFNAAGGNAGTLPVRYTITSDYATTAAQITHSFVGGISYRTKSKYPVVLGVGGLIELQESNRNSALETIQVWTKLGVQF